MLTALGCTQACQSTRTQVPNGSVCQDHAGTCSVAQEQVDNDSGATESSPIMVSASFLRMGNNTLTKHIALDFLLLTAGKVDPGHFSGATFFIVKQMIKENFSFLFIF